MFEGPTSYLSAITDDELNVRLQALSAELAIADSKLEEPSGRRSRTMLRGVVLTAAGILFAAPTGGLTLLLCVIGAIDMIDVVEEDVAAARVRARLRGDLGRQNALYERIAAEKDRRGWGSPLS